MIDVFDRLDVSRLIFHRKNSFADMESVIRHEREKGSRGVYEFEAFALNELCQFSGAFCNSLHCDEMGHLCRVPYKIGKVKGKREKKEEYEETERLILRTESTVKDANDEQSTDKPNEDDEERMYDPDGYLCGATGCGLCALYRLQKIGITHLKLVGRGNYVDFMEKDIRNLKTALDILEHVDTEEEYIRNLKRTLFPYGCSGLCYYRETESVAGKTI
jgi:collagenase-like PrtC family protease